MSVTPPRSPSPASRLAGTGIYPLSFKKREKHESFLITPIEERALAIRQAEKFENQNGKLVDPLYLPASLIDTYETTQDKKKAIQASIDADRQKYSQQMRYKHFLAMDSTKNGPKATELNREITTALQEPSLRRQTEKLLDIYIDQIRPFVKDNPNTRKIPVDSTQKKVDPHVQSTPVDPFGLINRINIGPSNRP